MPFERPAETASVCRFFGCIPLFWGEVSVEGGVLRSLLKPGAASKLFRFRQVPESAFDGSPRRYTGCSSGNCCFGYLS